MRDTPPRQNAASSPKASGIIQVTREMVHQRTRELTAIAGREPRQVRQTDYEQAMREVTGETEGDRQQAVLDAPLPDHGRGQTFARNDRG